MSVKNKAFSPPLFASCICSALSKLESSLDSKCTVHYELSEEFTASIAVNTFTSVSVLAIPLAWFRIRLKKEAGLGLLTAPALLQLYYSRKCVYTLLSKWGYGGRDILGIISGVGRGTLLIDRGDHTTPLIEQRFL
ncbi:hypothetical protein T09_5582 [Trichinella sp. T9]|nr:hypothetical protein T09_5582 [Trichinella sp. T9]